MTNNALKLQKNCSRIGKNSPSAKTLYNNELEDLWQDEGEIPPHIAFGDILNPFLINLLQKTHTVTSEDKQLLDRIFDFLEVMASSEELEVQEVVSLTVMARLGDDISILKNALKYMGNETKRLSKEIERFYGRRDNLKIL